MPPSEANPKGFFEHSYLREYGVKRILASAGYDPLGVRRLPPELFNPTLPRFTERVHDILSQDGYSGEQTWLYKDAKLSLLWALFAHHFPDARWVIVRRDTEKIIDSCLRTSFMKQHSTERSYWKKFVRNYHERLSLLVESDNRTFEISSEAVAKGDFGELESIVKALGLNFRGQAIQEFVNPQYWHA